jgi:hypothetical protein
MLFVLGAPDLRQGLLRARVQRGQDVRGLVDVMPTSA